MSKKSGLGKLALGAAIGAGLGVLFAPKEGSKTRKELKAKLDNLTKEVKNLEVEDIKKAFDKKVKDIKADLADLDKEEVLDVAKSKIKELKTKTQELVDMAIEKGTPVLRDSAEELKTKVVDSTKAIVKKLEEKTKK